ncbi:cytochrome c-type biogenesis protein [Idiomarina seosinensis]|uniref:cytochrome c-type biogenesis protein n=1 Tax=Idiomarina seosinensis TaxID=281739 RepID=UPI0018E54311|nr:cytochrome c-type biogenesis protein [Idiomarina seosinensis]
MSLLKGLLGMVTLVFSMALLAQQVTYDGYEFKTAEQRQTYQQLTQELRCPKCQNQNIADSNAPLAGDMRERAYNMVMQGHSKQEVIDHMVARYGNFAHYRPPFNLFTAVLWLAPLFIALVGIAIAIRMSRRRRQTVALSDQEREQLQQLKERSKDD